MLGITCGVPGGGQERGVGMSKLKTIGLELVHHLPFSIFGVASGLLVMGFLTFIAILLGSEDRLSVASQELFHVFHPTHILFSSVTTTAMFLKHEKRRLKAVVVGFFGSVTICGVSDVFFPFLGGKILGQDMAMHICIIEHPGLIIPFALGGILAGLFIGQSIEHSTEYSHSTHIFISSVSSILYLTAYGLEDWPHMIAGVFIVTILAVMIPCCVSDIAFPLYCVHRNCNHP